MRRNILITLAIACAFCGGAAAQDMKSIVEATIKNMGDVRLACNSASPVPDYILG